MCQYVPLTLCAIIILPRSCLSWVTPVHDDQNFGWIFWSRGSVTIPAELKNFPFPSHYNLLILLTRTSEILIIFLIFLFLSYHRHNLFHIQVGGRELIIFECGSGKCLTFLCEAAKVPILRHCVSLPWDGDMCCVKHGQWVRLFSDPTWCIIE